MSPVSNVKDVSGLYPPQPSPPRGRGEKGADLHRIQILRSARAIFKTFQNQSSTQIAQVGVTPAFTSVSPLSLRERARVRGFSCGHKKRQTSWRFFSAD